MTFKQYEIDYLNQATHGRLATVRPDGTPQNSPVGFSYNAELGTIDIAGYNMSNSHKYRNIAHNNAVALVVDDIASRDPWRVRCLEIRGTAEQVRIGSPASEPNGDQLDTAIIRITPRRIISFGIDGPDTPPHLLNTQGRDV
jgi:pyridoxamine 5'-phosphate oxidase family protein